MALTNEKQRVLEGLNNQAKADYDEAVEKALRAGKRAPEAPAPLVEENIEYPKWLHKGWKLSGKNEGHYTPSESKLVKNKAEHDAAGSGWSDSPKADAQAKKEPEAEPVIKRGPGRPPKETTSEEKG